MTNIETVLSDCDPYPYSKPRRSGPFRSKDPLPVPPANSGRSKNAENLQKTLDACTASEEAAEVTATEDRERHQQDGLSNRLSMLEVRSQTLSRSRKQLKLMTT